MAITELVERHRQYAAHCIEIAKQLPNTSGKLVLLDMAQSWLALAEQAAKNAETVLVYETPIPKQTL
jgi:hypothetical protein